MALDTIEIARLEIAKIYIAAFNRVPDANGLSNWMNQYLYAGMSYEEIAQDFTNQAEYIAEYPALLTNTEYVAKIYLNVFGRAADAGGLANWANQLQYSATTGIDRGNIMNRMIEVACEAGNTDGERLDNQASFGVQSILDEVPTDIATAQLVNITSVDATVTTATAAVAAYAGTITGTTFTLTTGVDTITGTVNNDTINATNTTLTALDAINGGNGVDTLNILNAAAAAAALPAGITVSNVETVNVRSADDIGVVAGAEFDVSGFTGVTTLNTTQSVDVAVKAAATTNINVSGATGAIEVIGGKDVTVSDAATDLNIIVSNGAVTTGHAAGAITVTDTVQGTGTITVDGGTTATVATTVTNAAAGAINVGINTAATGAVSVTQTVTASDTAAAADADFTLGAINVKGGSSVNVAVNVTATDTVDDADTVTATIGAIDIEGNTSTTTVSVSQTAAQVAVDPTAAVTGVNQVDTVTFNATLANGVGMTVNGITFTNTSGAVMTAAEVAAAFAGLSSTSAQGCSTKGIYTGAPTVAWSSGTVTNTSATVSTVDFTNSAAATSAVAVIAGGDAVALKTAGVLAVTAVAGKAGIVNSQVLIDDNATAASITTITVDGYATTSRIGTTGDTTALSSLTLKNAAADVTMTVDDTAATLALVVQGNMGTSTDADEAVVTFTAAPTTLNVTATGNNYIDLTAAATTTLNVAGTGLLNIADVDLAGLTTVAVTGSVSVVLPGSQDTITSITTTGTTGAVTATIEGARATYTGGAGVDTVTLATDTALTKAIDLGAGDDTLSFAALAVTGSTATLSGGAGTDTLSMAVATADALDALTQTFYTNFEKLLLNDTAGDVDAALDTVTIDLEKLNFTSYVVSNGTAADGANSDVLALSNMATNGTLEIVAAAAGANTSHTVAVKNAATGTADVLNVKVVTAAALNAGKVTAANVETINITADDTDTTAHSDTLILTAANATAVTVAGDASLTLTMTGSTAVTSINASSMTGGLTVTSLNTTAATTITGGAGNDLLTAATGTTADVLIGGAGNDTLTANAGLTTMTGGAGSDTFAITTASLNSSSYATITDATSGDFIKFVGADSFKAAAVTLADTAVFQDYVNATINALAGAGDLGWFQYGGNTYIAMDVSGDNTFDNGTDKIVKLTGVVNLATASFSDTNDTIQIC